MHEWTAQDKKYTNILTANKFGKMELIRGTVSSTNNNTFHASLDSCWCSMIEINGIIIGWIKLYFFKEFASIIFYWLILIHVIDKHEMWWIEIKKKSNRLENDRKNSTSHSIIFMSSLDVFRMIKFVDENLFALIKCFDLKWDIWGREFYDNFWHNSEFYCAIFDTVSFIVYKCSFKKRLYGMESTPSAFNVFSSTWLTLDYILLSNF